MALRFWRCEVISKLPLGSIFCAAVVSLSLTLSGCAGDSGKNQPIAADDEGSDKPKMEVAVSRPVAEIKFPVKGKYEVLEIMTDNKDEARAKSNAEDALTKHPDIACMVGLWAYNPPAILNAVEAIKKTGEIKIVGFDEHPETLNAIAAGKMEGTIVQQPFQFGYKSVEYLAAMARGQEVMIPENKMIYIPHSVITKENVEGFAESIKNIKEGKGTPPPHDRTDYDTSKKVKLIFVCNSVDPFWGLADDGIKLANPVFNADCECYQPAGASAQEQKQKIEDFITQGGQGLALSPIDAENQASLINQAAEKMPVICQDSDAPKSNRKFYLGTSNYLAGRSAGELVKKAIPNGGKVMIFVGKLEVLNAQERSRGVIDELQDLPIPAEFEDQRKASEKK
jgi:ribose transport system substrate-binding protein